MRRSFLAFVLLVASMALGAQEYPARTVRIVVPFAPGGGTDLIARILSQHLSQRLGQSFVVENRPAGSGIVGADHVAKSAPDGYTLLFAFSSLSSSAKLFSKLPYDPVRDFVPVALATTSPLLVVVPASLPAKDLREFIAHARAMPGKLNYGSSGPGSSPHLATELFMSLTGVQMAHISYKGIGPAITALLANEVQFSLVPTVNESGLPGFEVIAWWGMLAPAKTPRAVVERLNREVRAILDRAEVRRGMIDQGMDPAAGAPEQFAELIKTDMEKWGDIGKRLGVKLD